MTLSCTISNVNRIKVIPQWLAYFKCKNILFKMFSNYKDNKMHMTLKKQISKEGYKVTVNLLSVSALGIDIVSNFLYILLDILFYLPFLFFFSPIYFYQLEANYFTVLQWFFPYIVMNQPWIYMCSPSRSPSHFQTFQCTESMFFFPFYKQHM